MGNLARTAYKKFTCSMDSEDLFFGRKIFHLSTSENQINFANSIGFDTVFPNDSRVQILTE